MEEKPEIEIDYEEITTFFKKNKSKLGIILLLPAILMLFFGIKGLIIHYNCEQEGGFLLENSSCYIPANELERKELMEKGYLKINPYSIDKSILKWENSSIS